MGCTGPARWLGAGRQLGTVGRARGGVGFEVSRVEEGLPCSGPSL